jgi:hypothetical protein
MVVIHGNLLIGGMSLKDLDGLVEADCARSEHWKGMLTVTHEITSLLEVGRPYRLELDDGRAGQVVVRGIRDLNERFFSIDIEGRSPLRTKWVADELGV